MKNTVLVIDDDRMIVRLLQTLLTQQGYQVLVARDGQNGYFAARTKEPDLIICDLLLPLTHGFELIQKVKNNQELQKIPVILITAVYRGPQYRAKGKEYGAAAFFEKPLDPQQLISTVRRLLPLPGQAALPQDDQLDQQLDQLRDEYLLKLPQVIDWISNRCNQLLNDNWDDASARLLHQAAHRMIGCGKNLKLETVSEAAQRMEGCLDALLEQGVSPGAEERARLAKLLSDLCAAAEDPALSTHGRFN